MVQSMREEGNDVTHVGSPRGALRTPSNSIFAFVLHQINSSQLHRDFFSASSSEVLERDADGKSVHLTKMSRQS